jgi:lipopolysaccharide transport system ATP-binding protein/teichoic acid transport system ATP-binding protein
LHKGKMMMRGEPDEVIQAYTKFLQVGEAEAVSLEDL